MKKILIGSIAASLFAAPVVDVVKVKSIWGVHVTSPVVKKIKWRKIHLYPQTTLVLNDKKANELHKNAKAKVAYIGALSDGVRLAIFLKWQDPSKDLYKNDASDRYADGFAVQFASSAKDPKHLPYIGMGSDGRPVEILLHKAYKAIYEPNGHGDVAHQVNEHNTPYFGSSLQKFKKEVVRLGAHPYARAFVSEGFRSMSQIKNKSFYFRPEMRYYSHLKQWDAMVLKTFHDPYAKPAKGEYAIAVAIWDGKELERDGIKRLSSWIALRLPDGKNKELEQVVQERSHGNAARGKKLFEANCASCHRTRDFKSAPLYMAPGLENIGGQATAAYLRESITDPDAVVVPGYNRNAHPNYPWYTLSNGKRHSMMPSFGSLGKRSIEDIVAYLQTQKAEAEE